LLEWLDGWLDPLGMNAQFCSNGGRRWLACLDRQKEHCYLLYTLEGIKTPTSQRRKELSNESSVLYDNFSSSGHPDGEE